MFGFIKKIGEVAKETWENVKNVVKKGKTKTEELEEKTEEFKEQL